MWHLPTQGAAGLPEVWLQGLGGSERPWVLPTLAQGCCRAGRLRSRGSGSQFDT